MLTKVDHRRGHCRRSAPASRPNLSGRPSPRFHWIWFIAAKHSLPLQTVRANSSFINHRQQNRRADFERPRPPLWRLSGGVALCGHFCPIWMPSLLMALIHNFNRMRNRLALWRIINGLNELYRWISRMSYTQPAPAARPIERPRLCSRPRNRADVTQGQRLTPRWNARSALSCY